MYIFNNGRFSLRSGDSRCVDIYFYKKLYKLVIWLFYLSKINIHICNYACHEKCIKQICLLSIKILYEVTYKFACYPIHNSILDIDIEVCFKVLLVQMLHG